MKNVCEYYPAIQALQLNSLYTLVAVALSIQKVQFQFDVKKPAKSIFDANFGWIEFLALYQN